MRLRFVFGQHIDGRIMYAFVQIRTIRNDKLAKRKIKNNEKRAALQAKQAKAAEDKAREDRAVRKQRYIKEGKAEQRERKRARFE
eukprot:SAG31_NODE_87_length_26728_cov_40.161591_22_plen_85_part_00